MLSKENIQGTMLATILAVVLSSASLAIVVNLAYATTMIVDIPSALEKEQPTGNATLDAEEGVQMIIRPSSPLPPENGTVTMSLEGTNDIDFRGHPPVGVVVTIDNQTATVTNSSQQQTGGAELPTTAAAPTAPAATAPPADTGAGGPGSADDEASSTDGDGGGGDGGNSDEEG
jgi:dUTPase